MGIISYGGHVKITATFTDPDTGSSVDPVAVRCYVRRAGQTETLYTYGVDPAITKLAVGSYECVLAPPPASTSWFYRWEADFESLTSSYVGDFVIGPNRA